MALITCPECKKRISEEAATCPNCGYQLTPERIAEIKAAEQKSQRGAGIGCLVAIVVLVGLYALGSGDKDAPTTEKQPAVQPDSFKIAQPVDPAFSEQLQRDLPKLLKACPGLNAYSDDFAAATVSRPTQKNFEGGIEIKFTVTQQPAKLPSPLDTYSAGHACYFDIDKNGTVVSIAKNACSSLCDGTLRKDKSGALNLPLDKPSAVVPKTQEERKKEISKCFNPWDGSHRNLTDVVKEAMNDPKSFEHVETRYRDDGDRLFLSMTFRGKNNFGGTVKNMVTAEANMDCSIIKLGEFYK